MPHRTHATHPAFLAVHDAWESAEGTILVTLYHDRSPAYAGGLFAEVYDANGELIDDLPVDSVAAARVAYPPS